MKTLTPTERKRLALLVTELKQYQWRCSTSNCDGMPHVDIPYKHARSSQILDGHNIVALITGRGYGKTRAGAQRVAERMLATPKHGVLIMADSQIKARAVCIEGPSGLLAVLPPYAGAKFNQQKGMLTLKNGSWAAIFGANDKIDAERPRGFESSTVWCEEVGLWRWQREAWDNLQMANRSIIGNVEPQTIITTTPKPTPIIKMLFKWADEGNCKLIKGSLFDNEANLSPAYVSLMRRQYEGSTLGRQELHGELVEDVTGALWSSGVIEASRVDTHPPLARIVVAVDPSGGGSSEAGIIVAGKSSSGDIYILDDLSGTMDADTWGRVAAETYRSLQADAVVAERNFGGDQVQTVIRATDRGIPVKLINASRGKFRRAEPVRTLFGQNKVHLVGSFGLLESQMTTWVPPGQFEKDVDGIDVAVEASNYSPDRLDAMVWAVTELGLQPRRSTVTAGF